MKNTPEKDALHFTLSGRIDSGNAALTEKSLLDLLEGSGTDSLLLDASGLEYISSAGLRVLLRVRKKCPDVRITGVSSDIYEILETTGFTEIMDVEKQFRTVSIEGCEKIGHGAHGAIYRIGSDEIVKVFSDPDALDEIRHERAQAREALILGLPTAISYDVVRVGDTYGSVFELLDARPLASLLADDPGKMDWCVQAFVGLLKKIHGTVVPAGKFPDMRERADSWVNDLEGDLPEEAVQKLHRLIQAVPQNDHMLHGDYHMNNLMLQNDELMLVDMDCLAVGHPVFELGHIFLSYVGFSEVDHDMIHRFQGLDRETGVLFWKKTLSAYLGTACPAKLSEVEKKARVLGYTRLVRHSLRHHLYDTEMGKAELELWREELLSLLEETDTLVFAENELEIGAAVDNLPEVQAFLEERLDAIDCPMKAKMQISLAAEEIFVNIASYAYAPGEGKAIVRVDMAQDPAAVSVTFTDAGIPYNPLAASAPDVTLAAEEREIGGLGIFLTRKTMDDVSYAHRDGRNILRMTKKL